MAIKCRMFTQSHPLRTAISSAAFRRKWEAMAVSIKGVESGASRKKANLYANRKERIKLPQYGDGREKDFPISEFLAHPSGVEALLNTRALQGYEPIDSYTYRCTLHKIQLLKFDAVPVLDLRVTPTSEDCTVEMLSCKFEGSKAIEQQNKLFSAVMINHITWEEDGLEPCLEVDVNLKITLEINTKPFILLPVSVVEKPGNLVMQGIIDRLVPLLIEQLLRDYNTWVEEQLQAAPQHPHAQKFAQ